MSNKFLIFTVLILTFVAGIGISLNAAEITDETLNTEYDYMQPELQSVNQTCAKKEFFLHDSYSCMFDSTVEPIAFAQLNNRDDEAGTYQGGTADLWLERCPNACTTVSSWGGVYLGPGRYMKLDYYIPDPGSEHLWTSNGKYTRMDNGYVSLFSQVS